MKEFIQEFLYTLYLLVTDPPALMFAFLLLLLVVMIVVMVFKTALAIARLMILGFNYLVTLDDPSDTRILKMWKEREEKAVKRVPRLAPQFHDKEAEQHVVVPINVIIKLKEGT
jgi:hypothetical protein